MSNSNQITGILTADDILSLLERSVDIGGISIQGFEYEHLRPTCYDFACDFVLVPKDDETPIMTSSLLVKKDAEHSIYRFASLRLRRFQFCKLISKEKFSLPRNVIGHLYLRSRYARLGLVPVLMGRVEAGWSGRLVLELLNASEDDLMLEAGARLASLEFVRLHKAVSQGYTGSYMDFASDIADA